jgi:hypothetical protein
MQLYKKILSPPISCSQGAIVRRARKAQWLLELGLDF